MPLNMADPTVPGGIPTAAPVAAPVDPAASGGGGGGGSSKPPGIRLPTAVPSSYTLANDPNWIIAQNWANQQNQFAQQNLNLAGKNPTGGYVSQAGVQSAQLAYQLAQQQDQAAKDQATHQLPITLLGIVNGLAAHGVGNSGDATYLPGEAKYAYDTQLQGLAMDLAAKQAQIQIAQKDAAAAASANSSAGSAANANELARAQLAYQETLAQNAHDLQSLGVQLYQQAAGNGTALDPATLALLKGLGG